MVYKLLKGQTLGYVAAVPAILFGAGCTAQAPTVEQNQQRSAVSQPLEGRVAEVPRKISDEELLTSYNKTVEKVGPRVSEALKDFSRRSGYKDLGQIAREDYHTIVEQAWKEALTNDPSLKPVSDYASESHRNFVDDISKNLDMRKVSREKGPLYVGDRELPVFLDPELLLPAMYTSVDRFEISDIKVYQTKNGQSAVFVFQPSGFSDGVWVPHEYFGVKPGEYGRTLIKAELDKRQSNLQVLNDIMKKVKPDMGSDDLSKLIEDSAHEGLLSDLGFLSEGSPELNYKNLQEAATKFKKDVERLNQLLILK